MTPKPEKIILYPREYNKRGEANLHSVMGLTHNGEIVNVKLRISEEYQGAKSAPSIQEFSRSDRKAKTPAIASHDNSAINPEGIILFTGAIYEKTDKSRDIKHYIASWAHVIREDSDSSPPHIGIGRIKVKRSSSTAKMIKNKLKQEISQEQRNELLTRLESPASYEYSTVFYSPENQIEVMNHELLLARMEETREYFDTYHKKGMSFGYYAIYCDDGMHPIPNKSKEILSEYSPITGEIDNPSEYINRHSKDLQPILEKHGGLILIPCYKLNPTNNAKNYYAMDDRLRMIEDVFHTPEGHARANTIISKTFSIQGGRGTLFDKTHPLSYEKFNLDLMDRNRRESRIYSSSMMLDYNNSRINSIRVGLIKHEDYLLLSSMTNDRNDDIKNTKKEGDLDASTSTLSSDSDSLQHENNDTMSSVTHIEDEDYNEVDSGIDSYSGKLHKETDTPAQQAPVTQEIKADSFADDMVINDHSNGYNEDKQNKEIVNNVDKSETSTLSSEEDKDQVAKSKEPGGIAVGMAAFMKKIK